MVALVAQAITTAFDEAVLLRLAHRNVSLLDQCVLAPGKDGVTGQLGAVVADYHAWRPATSAISFSTAACAPQTKSRLSILSQAMRAHVVQGQVRSP